MPTRLLFDIGGTVPASGTLQVGGGMGANQPTSGFVQAKITAALSVGAGSWQVEIVRSIGTQGTLISTTYGPGIETAFILAPGEHVQATVTGATAGASVRGSVLGTQAHPAGNLPPLYANSFTLTQPAPPPISAGVEAAIPTPTVAVQVAAGQTVVVDSVTQQEGVTVVTYHLS